MGLPQQPVCFPSHEAIAARAGCARSTVAEALKALEWAGVLTWQHRIARMATMALRYRLGNLMVTITRKSWTRMSNKTIRPPALSGFMFYRKHQ